MKPRDVWLGSNVPVFFDFGDEALWWLQEYDAEYGVRAVRRVLKAALVSRNGGDPGALPSHTGVSPIHPQAAPDSMRRLWEPQGP